MTRFFSSIRVRLIMLVLFAILPALVLTLDTGLEQRRMAATQAQQEALILARSAADDQSHLIEAARQLLLILAHLPQVREDAPAACSAFLAGLLQQYPRYANFNVTEPNGDLRCSAVPPSGPVNYADRDWFVRVLQTRDFVVGSYTMGRVTARALIPFAYPILSDGGQVQAVLAGSIDLAWLNQFISKAHLPAGRTVTVIDRNGVILARHPDSERWVGQALPEAPIIRMILAQHAEGTAEVPGLDGVPRLHAFAPLISSAQGPDAYVAVGIPTAVAFAEPNRLLTRNLAALGFVTLLALAVAWVGSEISILRRVRGLLNATRRLAAGDLCARTGQPYGVGELSQLARAFDQMAESLQQRVAERAQAEEALHDALATQARLYESVRESERTLYALLDANPESALLMDTVGTVLIANEAITQRLGKDKRQLVGTNFYDDLPPETAEGRKARVAEVARTGQPIRFEDVHGDRHIDNYIHPVFDAEGKVARLAVLGIDITERMRMVEALKRQAADLTRSNRELQDFAYVASHDLQEPLRKIQAFGDRLGTKYSATLGEEGRDYLARMQNAAGRMSTMINDLLAYSRVTTKGQPFVPVDLGEVVREVIADLEIRIEETGGRVELGALPTVDADPLQMRQLLQNLIGNALKFHQEGVPPVVKVYQTSPPAPLLPGEGGAAPPPSPGEPALNVSKEGWGVGIIVEDNGIGFDEKYLDRIFTPFQRLHARGEYEGSGIGLAICRKIAERHGGTITARSAPGRGATFIVTLRIADS
jgi:PAS domain S-box-containing protein